MAASLRGAGAPSWDAARPRFVVGVSGGVDSTCLLDALVAAVPDPARQLVVGHVDHGLRPGSAADAEHVRAGAEVHGVRCQVLNADVAGLMAAERRGLEEAARLGRYRALGSLAAEVGADAVLTGHTRDDAAETVLLHLVRGSGPAGLAGIRPWETFDGSLLGAASEAGDGLLVGRPLLSVTRGDTTAYCLARGLPWREDQTNLDPAFLRNRVRHHLLPLMRTYNPAVDEALTRLAAVMRDEDEYLDGVARARVAELGTRTGGRYTLDRAAFLGLAVAVQRRVIRQVVAAGGYTALEFAAVERALAVARDGGPPRAELGGGSGVRRLGRQLLFEGMQGGAPPDDPVGRSDDPAPMEG